MSKVIALLVTLIILAMLLVASFVFPTQASVYDALLVPCIAIATVLQVLVRRETRKGN